jgi:hypothetical protein
MQARQTIKYCRPIVIKGNKLERFAARPEIGRQSDIEPVAL